MSHPEGCPCRRRRTELSGEIDTSGGTISGKIQLDPARPLTGFFSPPRYVAPTVIVSELLSFGANVEVMLLELDDRPDIPILTALPTDGDAAGHPRRTFHPPTRVRVDPLPRRRAPGRDAAPGPRAVTITGPCHAIGGSYSPSR